MSYMTNPDSPETSKLKMDHILFDEISFIRKGFKQSGSNANDLSIKVKVSICNLQNNDHRVSLEVVAEKSEEYTAKVAISGFCSVDADGNLRDDLLKKNAVAILFPYVRSELTLITAQPETEPIVMPPINVGGLIDSMAVTIDD